MPTVFQLTEPTKICHCVKLQENPSSSFQLTLLYTINWHTTRNFCELTPQGCEKYILALAPQGQILLESSR